MNQVAVHLKKPHHMVNHLYTPIQTNSKRRKKCWLCPPQALVTQAGVTSTLTLEGWVGLLQEKRREGRQRRTQHTPGRGHSRFKGPEVGKGRCERREQGLGVCQEPSSEGRGVKQG